MAESISVTASANKAEIYQQLVPQIKALIEPEKDIVANLANIAAVLKYTFNFFWVGFYIYDGSELVLNAFQGPVACTRISLGKGVCGQAFQKNETIIVPNVKKFLGHIACSAETKSEIVLPIEVNGKVLAVLDVDSEFLNHFDETDKIYLNKIIQLINPKW